MGKPEQQLLRGTGSEIYERGLGSAVFAPWAALLIEQAELQPGKRVLDVACGTGAVVVSAQVNTALQSYLDPDGLALPMQAHPLTAHK